MPMTDKPFILLSTKTVVSRLTLRFRSRTGWHMERFMHGMFSAVLQDDRGQGLAEYGLILGLIAVLCIAAVVFLSGSIQGILSNVGSSI